MNTASRRQTTQCCT